MSLRLAMLVSNLIALDVRMDPIRNPFFHGAGSPPPELAGRAPILEQARILLGRALLGKLEKSLMLTGLARESKSYAEHLFAFPDVGALSAQDANKAISEPALAEGVEVTSEALAETYRLTQGYPCFIQEWGYQMWNLAQESPIEISVVKEASESVIKRLDQNFFRVRFDRLTPSVKNFLRVMAELGPGETRSGDNANYLGIKVNSIDPVRAKLIKKGMIYSPAYGDIAFTVPLFDEFMKRTIPDFAAKV